MMDAQRRNWLLGGVGAAAGLVGLGVAWKFHAPTAQPDDPALQALWPLSFETPSGREFAMASFRNKPLIVNFWATWCPPCVEELPLLDAFSRQSSSKGWQVVGLAIDQPSSVRSYLKRLPLGFTIGLAGLGGMELIRALGNEPGGLPFTVIVAADGSLIRRKMGKLEAADLRALTA